MTQHDWNAHYASGELPWDTGEPDKHLVELVHSGLVSPGRALEIGCGTGTNALWMAARGFEVLALDLAPLAIERARAKATARAATGCRFEVHDFLAQEPPAGGFQLVFDRGCFHVFCEADQQASFAARVAQVLSPGGVWLSLMGSTEGGARDFGPPRRSAREVTGAIEPALELLTLRAISFEAPTAGAAEPKAWYCLSQRRNSPAVAPTTF